MSILVVCPGCHKSFTVDDKHAGKTGACPKCKAKITVPTKEAEVTVHAPTEFAGGGRTTTGKLALKPVARRQTRLSPVMAAAIGAGVVTAVLVAWFGGSVIRDSLVVRSVGLLVISPPLIVGAYSFLRDDELEPHAGRALVIRVAICSLAYIALWGLYGYFSKAALSGELWEWLFVLPPFLGLGALVAFASLDLDFGSGFFHCAFYVLVTVLLGMIAGIHWVSEAVGAGVT